MSRNAGSARGPRRLPINWLEDGATLEIVTHSPAETMLLGDELARDLPSPCLVLLEGELGAGKTTLVKGIVRGLGAAREGEVTSPSFALVHEYGAGGKVYHIDLYRVESSQELSTLGLDDMLSGSAVVLIEWGEKLGEYSGNRTLRIRMEHAGEDVRKVVVLPQSSKR
ncbi:MAG: tRNA (adenosine(37)-N6)-threonylcarbamoyltransferase complex ATPase subunit type 1 TsaE [Deltaproteobacteria bacterium]